MLLLFAAAHLVVRGPVDLNGNVNLCDLATHYASARLWLVGADPYDRALMPVAWQASGWGATPQDFRQWWSLLPPGGLVVLAPLAALPPGIAMIVWGIGGIGLFAAAISSVLWLANFRANTLSAWLVISAAAASAPFQTLYAVGQASFICVAAILVALRCAQSNRRAWAGILLGIAGSMKPHLVLPFGLFYLIYRNWRIAWFALTSVLVLNLIGIAQLEWRDQPWLTSWLANIRGSTAPGNGNDATITGPLRHQIISLQVLLASLPASKALVSALNALLSAALVGTYAWLARRGRLSADSLLSLSIVASIALLPVYHKSYDAALLALPFAWALSALRGPLRRAAWGTLAALSVFLVPFDLLHLMELRLGFFSGVSRSWIWRAAIEPHHAWAALGVCLCLLGSLYIRVRQLSTYVEAEDAPQILKLHADQRADDTALRWRTARHRTRARRTG
jgi:hypothetical protein